MPWVAHSCECMGVDLGRGARSGRRANPPHARVACSHTAPLCCGLQVSTIAFDQQYELLWVGESPMLWGSWLAHRQRAGRGTVAPGRRSSFSPAGCAAALHSTTAQVHAPFAPHRSQGRRRATCTACCAPSCRGEQQAPLPPAAANCSPSSPGEGGPRLHLTCQIMLPPGAWLTHGADLAHTYDLQELQSSSACSCPAMQAQAPPCAHQSAPRPRPLTPPLPSSRPPARSYASWRGHGSRVSDMATLPGMALSVSERQLSLTSPGGAPRINLRLPEVRAAAGAPPLTINPLPPQTVLDALLPVRILPT